MGDLGVKGIKLSEAILYGIKFINTLQVYIHNTYKNLTYVDTSMDTMEA